MERSPSIEYGAFQAVRNCTQVKPGENVLIITDRETAAIGMALLLQATDAGAGNVDMRFMEAYGERSEDGTNPLQFPDELRELISQADVSFYAAGVRPNELESFRHPMIKAIESNPRLRHAHMPKIDEVLMTIGMTVDYTQVQRVCAAVYETVKHASTIKVTSPAGTNLKVDFDPNYRWVVSDGQINTPGAFHNLPDGEVYTCALNANGVIVVDGILGDHFSPKYGLLEKTPVTLTVKEGRVLQATCSNGELVTELRDYMKKDENANRIGEFAVGTNIGLERLVGNLLQDEKFPGVHVAIGHGYPNKTGSDWDSKAHMDAVLKNVSIYVDEKEIMRNGTFIPDILGKPA